MDSSCFPEPLQAQAQKVSNNMETLLTSRLKDIIHCIMALTNQCEQFNTKQHLDSNDIKQAEICCTELETLYEYFSEVLYSQLRSRVITLSADNISDFSSIQLYSEEVRIELMVKLKRLERVPNEDQLNNSATCSKLSKNKNRRIWVKHLPKFKGDILQWQQFWENFTSEMDSLPDLSDADKLFYLKVALSGDALKVVAGLETTNENFQMAVTTLKECYGNKARVVDAHYAALFEIKTAGNTAEDCRQTFNAIEQHLKALNSLGEDTNHNHLRSIIIKKFPPEIIDEVKIELRESIEDIRRQLEILILAREGAMNQNNDKTQNKRKLEDDNVMKPRKKKRTLSCVFCEGFHYNDKCQAVKSLKGRKAKLNIDNRCFNCFTIGHKTFTCNIRRKCLHCGGEHNRAICPSVCEN